MQTSWSLRVWSTETKEWVLKCKINILLGPNCFLRSLLDTQVSARLLMRSEGDAQAGKETFSHLLPLSSPHTCLITRHISPHPPLNLDVNLERVQTCHVCACCVTWNSNGRCVWKGNQALKILSAENNHLIYSVVQESHVKEWQRSATGNSNLKIIERIKTLIYFLCFPLFTYFFLNLLLQQKGKIKEGGNSQTFFS